MKRSNVNVGLSRLLSSIGIVLLTISLVACGSSSNSHVNEPTQTIVEIAQGDDQFSTLVAALSKADLVGALSGDGPLTVFAPTNAAFTALASGLGVGVTDLLDLPNLKDILLYHVASGQLTGEKLLEAGTATTLETNALSVKKDGDAVVINDSVKVTTADVLATNGVIHIIDAVLLPPKPSIVDIAVGDPRFTTLVSAVTALDLATTLSGEGTFTVFAPTNAAFEAAATALNTTVDGLFQLPNIKDIVLYHVAGQTLDGAAVLAAGDITTLQGQAVSAKAVNGGVVLNDSINVTQANIEASNGIIHVIDGVLLPPAD